MCRHLAAKVGTSKRGGIIGKLPLRTCPGCSVLEPYRFCILLKLPQGLNITTTTTTNNNNNNEQHG